jgi:WD40 repeat protein
VPELEVWDLSSGKKRSPPFRLAGAEMSGAAGGFVCLTRPETTRGANRLNADGPICRWDLNTGKLAAPPWQPPVSTWYRFATANDSILVTHCRDGRIRLFDLQGGRQLGGHVSVPTLHAWGPMSIGMAVSADGASLATVSQDSTVRCWDVQHLVAQSRRACLASPSHFPSSPGEREGTGLLAFSDNGTRAFFARGNTGRIVAVDSGQVVGGPIEHDNLSGAVFSPDGSYLATVTLASSRAEPALVRVWDTKGRLHCSHVSEEYIHGLRFSPDGRLLALACVHQTLVLDVGQKKILHVFREKTCAINLSFSPDGRRLAVGYRGGWAGPGAGFRIWDLETGEPASPFHRGWSWWSVSHPLGYAAGGDALVVLDPDGQKLTCLDLRGKETGSTGMDIGSPGLLAVTPSSPLVALTSTGGTIELWHAGRGQRLRAIRSGCEVQALSLSPDGAVLAAVCSDQAIRLWDTATGFSLGPAQFHPSPVAALAFRPQQRDLVTATLSGQLFRWPAPSPMTGSPQDCERQLEARLGVTFAGGEATLLTPEAWQSRRRESSR